MSTISPADITKLAALSALSLNEQELDVMQTDLSQILEFVEQLQQVDTSNIQPTYQVHDLETVTRPDEIIDYGISQSDLLANTPDHREGSIVVPRVLE